MIDAKEARQLANESKRFTIVLAEELEKLDNGIRKKAAQGETEIHVMYRTPNPLLTDFSVLLDAIKDLGYEFSTEYEISWDQSLTSALLHITW